MPNSRYRPALRFVVQLLVILLLMSCARQPQKTPTPAATSTAPLQFDTPAPPEPTPTAHETEEGVVLGTETAESVYAGASCPAGAPVREYHLVAINVEITLNRYLDYDPQGRMYVLEENLGRVRQEEAQNKAARLGQAEPAVSIGLQGDAIQPLILRVNQGDCLHLSLRNAFSDNEPASLHLHGSSLHLAATGAPAIANNLEALARPGETVTYEWWVTNSQPEGTHYFHSHGNDRDQTNHGLFGALIVEPEGSQYLDPLTGGQLRSGWSAIVQVPNGSDFREFALVYHEVGDERYRLLNKGGQFVPQVDPYTDAYRPDGRALNYRSEPFMNRLALQKELSGKFDKSGAYSSYVFGDPATPIARSYLGDPVKQRIIHGGSEVFHVHHVHGGAIRWRRQPNEESANFDSGLDKHPPITPASSERVDSQALGPSETFDLATECGSGGCQQSAGDFLVHCHVAQHYLAGMWTLWRVYNTLQDGSVALDMLPPLQELPDRQGRMQAPVTSSRLANRTVDWKGETFTITAANLSDWVERQLPPPGAPKGYDASVLDWTKQADLYLNEPDSTQSWPGFHSPAPSVRPPIYFDPLTGKLAYPFLRPHLTQRPPFAPNHGPAPFLDPIHTGTQTPQPGANGPWSVCPAGTQLKQFVIHAINLPLTLDRQANLVDPSGSLFVLKDQEAAVLANPAQQVPLALRANAGEDCLDVILKSELADTRENAFLSKVNLHIHFVQFDVQASDGVDAGFNYEQSVRPFTVEGEKLAAGAAAGATGLSLAHTERFQPGVLVGVGMEQVKTFEIARILSISGQNLRFDAPLQFAHGAGEIVSTEFVRYRWYPDVQFGTAYFHDHVDALHSWSHGLFGALIAEPPGSTYFDSQTGAPIESGILCDVHTLQKVSTDVSGSFREMVLFLQDENLITHLGNSRGSSFNLRVEPLAARGGAPWSVFSSASHGDPFTPLFEAYVGDPLVIRGLVASSNDVNTLHVDGHWFRLEPWSKTSPPISTVHIGISERYDLVLPKAGGPQQLPGDYLYYNGRTAKLAEGSWGILRVHDPAETTTLQKLPDHPVVATPLPRVCPANAPAKEFDLSALQVPLPMLKGGKGLIYALQSDKAVLLSGTIAPEPLVLHVNVGDCVQVKLANELGSPVSFHADQLAFDPKDSQGIDAGNNPSQVVAAGETRLYTFYASPEVGETTALVRDWGNVLVNPRLGLYGAIIVGPPGAHYTDPVTGADVSLQSSWRVVVHPAAGPSYRDFTLMLQDEDLVIGTAVMPYAQQVQGVVGLNYRAEPLDKRLQQNPDTSSVFSSALRGDPATPLLEAFAGDAIRIHVLAPSSEQAHVFTLEGHQWPLEPGHPGSSLLSSIQVGALEAVTLTPLGGAGGEAHLPGDYLYGDHREPYREAGLWGLFRVYRPNDSRARILPLSTN